jgi:hypothetical protein
MFPLSSPLLGAELVVDSSTRRRHGREVSSLAPPDVPAPYGPAHHVPEWLSEILDVVLEDL